MINVKIPGNIELTIKHIVFDFNGTIATDGKLIPEIKEKFVQLKETGVNIHILTADTNGTVSKECEGLPVQIQIFPQDDASKAKKAIVEKLGKANTAAVGNGNNDEAMFKASALSIAVIGREGCSSKTLLSADIIVTDIHDAFDLLLKSNRLTASLRG